MLIAEAYLLLYLFIIIIIIVHLWLEHYNNFSCKLQAERNRGKALLTFLPLGWCLVQYNYCNVLRLTLFSSSIIYKVNCGQTELECF